MHVDPACTSGNHLTDFLSQFTIAIIDNSRPSVVGQRPGNGASGFALNSSIVLYINEPLQELTIATALNVSENGVTISGTVHVSGNGEVIESVTAAPWQNNALDQVFLDNTAKDLAGNALQQLSGLLPHRAGYLDHHAARGAHQSQQSRRVLLNPVIELEYNEPLDPATINSNTVSLRQNTGNQSLIPSTVSPVRGDRVIRIVPDAPLAPNASHFYQVSNTIRDLDAMSPGFFSTVFFNTATVVDNTTPQVLAVSPFDGATDVGIKTQIHVRFDEPINTLAVTGGTVLVSTNGSNVSVPCTISPNNNDREVLIVPHSPLPGATLMTIKVEGVEDLAGDAVLVHTTQFTTAAAPDSAPQILRTNPFNGATDVPVNTIITLESSEALDPVTINSNTFIVRDNVTFTNVAGTVSLSMNGRTLTFAPNTPLAVGRNHSVFFAVQGIQDLADNFLNGSNFSFTTSFAADVISPQVTGGSPAAGLTQVPINAHVVVTFNEPIQTQSVENVTLTAGATPITVTRTLSNANRTLTLTRMLLSANTLFITDLTGQDINFVFISFTTASGNAGVTKEPRLFEVASGQRSPTLKHCRPSLSFVE